MKTRRQFLSDLGLRPRDRRLPLDLRPLLAPRGRGGAVRLQGPRLRLPLRRQRRQQPRHPVRRLRHVPEDPRRLAQHPEGLPPEGRGREPEGRVRPPPGARRDPPALRQGAARRPRERRPARGAAHARRVRQRRTPPREPLLAQRPAGPLAVVRRVEGRRVRADGLGRTDGRRPRRARHRELPGGRLDERADPLRHGCDVQASRPRDEPHGFRHGRGLESPLRGAPQSPVGRDRQPARRRGERDHRRRHRRPRHA